MAIKNVKTNLDLNQNEIQNPSFHRTSGAPTASPTQSQYHFDTVDEKFKYYGNSTWRVPAVELDDLEDVSTATASVGDRLVFDGTDWIPQTGAFTVNELMDLSATSSQTITSSGGGNPTTYIDITWGTQIILGSQYSHTTGSTASQVIVNNDGYYEITYSVSTDVGTNNRSISNSRLVLDTGGGFTEVTRSLGYAYNRTSTAGEGTVTKTMKLSLSSGDILKVQTRRLSGSGNIITIVNGCNITMTKLT